MRPYRPTPASTRPETPKNVKLYRTDPEGKVLAVNEALVRMLGYPDRDVLLAENVLRWEYLPGSTLFLVWAHGREASEEDRPREPWQDDFRNLFRQRPDNTFLVKVAYWFGR